MRELRTELESSKRALELCHTRACEAEEHLAAVQSFSAACAARERAESERVRRGEHSEWLKETQERLTEQAREHCRAVSEQSEAFAACARERDAARDQCELARERTADTAQRVVVAEQVRTELFEARSHFEDQLEHWRADQLRTQLAHTQQVAHARAKSESDKARCARQHRAELYSSARAERRFCAQFAHWRLWALRSAYGRARGATRLRRALRSRLQQLGAKRHAVRRWAHNASKAQLASFLKAAQSDALRSAERDARRASLSRTALLRALLLPSSSSSSRDHHHPQESLGGPVHTTERDTDHRDDDSKSSEDQKNPAEEDEEEDVIARVELIVRERERRYVEELREAARLCDTQQDELRRERAAARANDAARTAARADELQQLALKSADERTQLERHAAEERRESCARAAEELRQLRADAAADARSRERDARSAASADAERAFERL